MNESITWNRYLIGQVPQLFVAGKLQNISSENKVEASIREEKGNSLRLWMGNYLYRLCQHIATNIELFWEVSC